MFLGALFTAIHFIQVIISHANLVSFKPAILKSSFNPSTHGKICCCFPFKKSAKRNIQALRVAQFECLSTALTNSI